MCVYIYIYIYASIYVFAYVRTCITIYSALRDIRFVLLFGGASEAQEMRKYTDEQPFIGFTGLLQGQEAWCSSV